MVGVCVGFWIVVVILGVSSALWGVLGWGIRVFAFLNCGVGVLVLCGLGFCRWFRGCRVFLFVVLVWCFAVF